MNTTAIIAIAAMSMIGYLFCVWMASYEKLEVR